MVSEVLVRPGECRFGDESMRLRTLLGSCVAVTMWHPRHKLGALAHCMLPQRPILLHDGLDGRYVDEALLWMLREAVRRDTDPSEYEFKVFGGAAMFDLPGVGELIGVGAKNSAFAQRVIRGLRLKMAAQDTGGNGHRVLIFGISGGNVWIRQGGTSG